MAGPLKAPRGTPERQARAKCLKVARSAMYKEIKRLEAQRRGMGRNLQVSVPMDELDASWKGSPERQERAEGLRTVRSALYRNIKGLETQRRRLGKQQ
jgi:hypothetical protein